MLHDVEWTKFLVIHFFQRFYYFEVLSLKPYLRFNLEAWLSFIIFINIFLGSLLCWTSKLNINNVQRLANHTILFYFVRFTILFTFWISNLRCETWFCKVNTFIMLVNVLCCKQINPWTKCLISYLNDNWSCITNIVLKLDWPILFAHLFRGERLVIILLSHLKNSKKLFQNLDAN